jgi:hypothetical protein
MEEKFLLTSIFVKHINVDRELTVCPKPGTVLISIVLRDHRVD